MLKLENGRLIARNDDTGEIYIDIEANDQLQAILAASNQQ